MPIYSISSWILITFSYSHLLPPGATPDRATCYNRWLVCAERNCCSWLREGDRYWIYLSSWTIKNQTKSIEWQFLRHWSPGNKGHWSLTLNRKLGGESLFSRRLLPYENFQALALGGQVGWILVVLLSWEESLKRAKWLEVTGHGAGHGRFSQREHLEALLRVLSPECPACVCQEILNHAEGLEVESQVCTETKNSSITTRLDSCILTGSCLASEAQCIPG